jgi:dTDP-4-dehydrorhamnose reductase
MKTIIIGGSGLFGLNWAIKQYQTDEIILLLHNKHVEFNGVKSIKIDYNNYKTLEENIKSLEPDLIINAAAITNVDFCESNSNLTYEANVQLAFDLAKIASKLNSKFLHISTDHLFDGINEIYFENDIPNPLNQYAKSKAEAEAKVLSIYKKSLIIRTNFFCWGPIYRKTFSEIIVDSLRNNTPLNLFSDVFYTPIEISELIESVLYLLNNNNIGIFNISSDMKISKYDFGVLIAKHFDLDYNLIKTDSINSRKNLVLRPYNMSLSNNKVKSEYYNFNGDINNNILRFKLYEESLNFKILHNLNYS